jgi:mono/diheme cytochrome c family protein
MSDDRGGASRQATREQREPMEGREPAPLFVWAAGLGVAVFGFVYYVLFTGHYRPDEGDERTSQLVVPEGPPDGADIFLRVCSACHQPTGLGVAGVYPPLARSPWVLQDDLTPIRILLLGIQGPIEVNGRPYNGQMPTWRAALNDAQIAAVLTYVRSHFENNAGPIDASAVARLRAQYASRTTSWGGGAELEAAFKEAPNAPVPTP